MKHTPGPWTFFKRHQGQPFWQIGTEGVDRVTKDDELDIATVETSREDAKLIAAAPELLEALKATIEPLTIAEYRLRVNDWAEGDPNENDDDDGTTTATYRRSLTSMQDALKLAKKVISKAERAQP
jgi:hypothetical protein